MADEVAREEKRRIRKSIDDAFHVLGKVNEGTFGVVYKAIRTEDKPKWEQAKHNQQELHRLTFLAIKKPKNSREGEGFNKDAVREIALLKELSKHPNIVTLRDVVLCPDGSAAQRGLYLVFDWAEYELCEILRTHRERNMRPPSERMVKSIMWQILNGIAYIHNNWVIHRDLKPSNILIMGKGHEHGRVKIADFGMARLFQQPLRALHYDGVVVTVWYRAPELLLGAKHYSKAIDMWAIGCIFGELLTNSPLFQGKEDKAPKALQEDQLKKIFKVVGTPTIANWSQLAELPEWDKVAGFGQHHDKDTLAAAVPAVKSNPAALSLLKAFFDYDPARRIAALDAMRHDYFKNSAPFPLDNVFLSEGAGSSTIDGSFYGPRTIHSVGMNGQSLAQALPPSSQPPPQQQRQMSGTYNQGGGAGQKRGAPGHHAGGQHANKMQRK